MSINVYQAQLITAKNTPLEGWFAMRAIRHIAKTGQPMPKELLPWLDKACDAYNERQGQRVKSRLTLRKNEGIVSDVHMLRKHGYKRVDAIAAIAERDNIAASSVERYYKTGNNKAKEMCDRVYKVMQLLDESNIEDAIALDRFSPRSILSRGEKKVKTIT